MSKLQLGNREHFKHLIVPLIVLVPLLIGLTHFPKILGDEGIYVSQGWWLAKHGKLGPYTYWYDHFPLGWLQIGLWQRLTGGPFTFGMSVFSGRMFMALLASLTGLGVYKIVRQLNTHKLTPWFALFLFSFSPMAIIFHRQVLLDNIATFWSVWAVYFLIAGPKKLKNVVFSGLLLSISMLSKETIVVMVPVFLVAIWWFNKREKHARYLIALSGLLISFSASLFGLLALLKGELFPSSDKVSLLGTIGFQLGRGEGVPFYESGSQFLQKLTGWLFMDPILTISGLLSLIASLVWFWRDKKKIVISLFGLSILAFLARGGLVLDFYIIPLVPWLAIATSLVFDMLLARIKSIHIKRIVFASTITIFTAFYLTTSSYIYTYDATQNQTAALEYLKNELENGGRAVGDNFFFLDIVGANSENKEDWPIHWYTKAALDREIRDELFNDQSEKIKFMAINSTMQQEIDGNVVPLLAKAQEQMQLVQSFTLQKNALSQKLLSQFPYAVEDVHLYSRANNSSDLDELVKNLSLDQQIGQHFLIGLKGQTLTATESALISQGFVSGVVIASKNIDNSQQLARLIDEINQNYPYNVSPFIAVAHEGGRFSPIPWIDTLAPAYWKSESEASERGVIRGRQLNQIGINMLFAPIVEKNIESSKLAEDERTVPNQRVLPVFIDAIENANIVPAIKFYPGVYSHVLEYPENSQIPVISITDDQLQDDIAPYSSLANQFNEKIAIMVAPAYYDQDKGVITSSSKRFIQTMIREDMNFDGLIISNNLDSITRDIRELKQLSQDSLNAGMDLIVLEDASNTLDLIKQLSQDESLVADTTASLIRILKSRERKY